MHALLHEVCFDNLTLLKYKYGTHVLSSSPCSTPSVSDAALGGGGATVQRTPPTAGEAEGEREDDGETTAGSCLTDPAAPRGCHRGELIELPVILPLTPPSLPLLPPLPIPPVSSPPPLPPFLNLYLSPPLSPFLSPLLLLLRLLLLLLLLLLQAKRQQAITTSLQTDLLSTRRQCDSLSNEVSLIVSALAF